MTVLATAFRRAARPPVFDGWTAGAVAIAALVAVPLAAIAWRALDPSDDTWRHLAATVLPTYVSNTLWLMLGVGLGTIVIGASTAWLVTMYRFPGRRVLSWALLLPLAVPSYVLAFVITDQLEYAGPIQGVLREAFGWTSARDYRFPEIRSLGGAALVLSLVLYPYVYLLARAAFTEQCFCLFEASRTLGRGRPAASSPLPCRWRARASRSGSRSPSWRPSTSSGPWTSSRSRRSPAGSSTSGSTWTARPVLRSSRSPSSRSPSPCLPSSAGPRHRGRVHATTTRVRGLPEYPLSRAAGAAALAWCALPVLLGFGLPAAVLAGYAIEFHEAALAREYLALAGNSLRLALAAAVVTTTLGLVLAYGVRLSRRPAMRGMAEAATVGYAVPGAVLAVGFLYPFGAFDNTVDALSRDLFGVPTGLVLSGTVAGLVLGYSARFLSLSYRTLDAGLGRVTPSMDGAARTLGSGPGASLAARPSPARPAEPPRRDPPRLRRYHEGAAAHPAHATVRLRDSRDLRVPARLDELLEECALGALTIVAAGLLPVALISRTITRARPGHRPG